MSFSESHRNRGVLFISPLWTPIVNPLQLLTSLAISFSHSKHSFNRPLTSLHFIDNFSSIFQWISHPNVSFSDYFYLIPKHFLIFPVISCNLLSPDIVTSPLCFSHFSFNIPFQSTIFHQIPPSFVIYIKENILPNFCSQYLFTPPTALSLSLSPYY